MCLEYMNQDNYDLGHRLVIYSPQNHWIWPTELGAFGSVQQKGASPMLDNSSVAGNFTYAIPRPGGWKKQ